MKMSSAPEFYYHSSHETSPHGQSHCTKTYTMLLAKEKKATRTAKLQGGEGKF